MRKLCVTILFLPWIALFADSGKLPDPLVVLREECVSCHTPSKRKGGLLIDSRESLIKGGDTDAAIVPGNADKSFLLETLFPDADPHMPPKSQLDPRDISAIENWINSGAKWDSKKWAKLNVPPKRNVEPGTLPGRYQPALTIALSPNNDFLVVGRGSSLDWYQTAVDQEKKTPLPPVFLKTVDKSHQDTIQSLAFSPDGKTLASGGFQSIALWDVSKPEKPIKRISDPFHGRVSALLFLPDGKHLLAADSLPSQLGRLHRIELSSGKVTTFNSAHRDTIFSLVLSPDGKRYATTSADKLITLRDSKTQEITMRLEGHTGYVIAAAFNPTGDRLVSAGDDEELKVWNLDTGKKLSSFQSKRSGTLYDLAWVIDPTNRKKQEEEKNPEKAAAINIDRILVIPESGRPAAFTELKEHEGSERSTGAKERGFDAVETTLYSLAVHSESLWSFAGGEDGKLYVWDENGKRKAILEPPVAETPPPAPNE